MKKKPFVDDQRSITDMNVEGFSWYIPRKAVKQKSDLAQMKLTRKERRAMILGAFQVFFPVALLMMGLMLGAFLLISFWLS